MSDDLDDRDRAMLADLRAQSRVNTARKVVQWLIILVPTVPVVTLSILFGGMFIGGVGSIVGAVVWGLAVQKIFPVRDGLTSSD